MWLSTSHVSPSSSSFGTTTHARHGCGVTTSPLHRRGGGVQETVTVIVSFVALAIVCSVSASNLTQEFEFSDVMPDDSYVTDFLDSLDEYTARSTVAPYAYFRFVDQSQEDIQEQMEAYVNDLVSISAIEEQPEFFWLRDFKAFVVQDETGTLSTRDFAQQLDVFLSDLVYFDLCADHIVRNETSGHIIASRVELQMDNVDTEDVNDQIDALKDQRSVTSRQPINTGQSEWRFFSYDGIYDIWEFYAVSVDELILTTVLGVVAVTGVALVFIPHWTGALFVLPMICLLYIDLLGVMQWAGVHVNAVSYIALVMSIGWLVDFILHVLLRYYESSVQDQADFIGCDQARTNPGSGGGSPIDCGRRPWLVRVI